MLSDEEKAKEYFLSLELEKGNKIFQLKEVIEKMWKVYLDGLAEGRKEKYEMALSQIKHDREKVIEYNETLKKEIAELKKNHESDKRSLSLIVDKGLKLEEQIKKMQCCLNCKYQIIKTKDDLLFCCKCKQLDEQKEKIILTKWELKNE